MKHSKNWNKLEDGAVIIFFILIFIILFLQFFTRYVLNNSLGWTEELARVLLICLCFLGAVVNARKKSEICLEVAKDRLPEKIHEKLDIFIVRPITTIIYFWLAMLMTLYTTKARQYLSSIEISKKYIIALVAFSFFLMALHSLSQWITLLKKRGGK